jgi:hypothetical protein
VIVEADLPLPNITGVWSMRASSSATHDKYLGVSFASQTVFLAMEEDDDLSELSASGGLAADVRTLFCGTTVSDLLLQVHAGAVHLVQASSLAMCDRWQPPEGTQITVCCAAASQVRSLLIFSVSHVSFSRVRWSLRLAERRLCTCELPE